MESHVLENSNSRAELTVVVPVRNRAHCVRETLESIAGQTRLPRRVVLVDDHSTDGTPDVLRSFAKSENRFEVVVLASEGRGACAARNRGLDAVETEWTMFFDSDDVMADFLIERAFETLRQHPSAEIVGWTVERINLDGTRRILGFDTKEAEWHNLMHGNFATQRYMARTALFRRAGGWNENQPIWNDIELGVRLLKENPTIVKCPMPGPAVEIRVSTDSITGRSWSERFDEYVTACQNLRTALGYDDERMIDLKMAILAGDMARENTEVGRRFYKLITHRDFRTALAYGWRRLGFRGAARLFKPLFIKKKGRGV